MLPVILNQSQAGIKGQFRPTIIETSGPELALDPLDKKSNQKKKKKHQIFTLNPFRSIRQISNKKALDHLHLEPFTNNLLVPKDRIQPLQAKALPAVWGTTQ